MITTDVYEATHVKVDGQIERIASKWGVGPRGSLAKPSEGGFGVVTESGRPVHMYDAELYFKEDTGDGMTQETADELFRRIINPTGSSHTLTPWTKGEKTDDGYPIEKDGIRIAFFARAEDRDLALYFTNAHAAIIGMLRNIGDGFEFGARNAEHEPLRDFLKRQAEMVHISADLFCRLGRLEEPKTIEQIVHDGGSLQDKSNEALELAARIGPMLHGKGPDVQSSALADLVAMWIAGHQNINDPNDPEVEKLREDLLDNFTQVVRALIPVNDDILRDRRSDDD